MEFDLLIVGAGPVGCVVAERAASQMNWTSLIIDRRNHIGGNCFDRLHDSGVLIHQYGPHYFRTHSPELIKYLSPFTAWLPGNYRVLSQVNNELYPFPINRTTLESFFKKKFLSEEEAKTFLASLAEPIPHPQNSEEFVLSRVGRKLYEAFFEGYTLKQWGIHPRELSPSVCGRVPIRYSREDRYVDHPFQIMPDKGYTEMFRKMIRDPRITVWLETDFDGIRDSLKPKVATLYTGPIDHYFRFALGRLPWRSLDFQFVAHKADLVQSCVQINYPDAFSYTRSVEIKHTTHQKVPGTVVSFEYPTSVGDPYYPVPNSKNEELYQKYRELADAERAKSSTYFCGRLAQYTYLNTDEAMQRALSLFEKIRCDFVHRRTKRLTEQGPGKFQSSLQ